MKTLLKIITGILIQALVINAAMIGAAYEHNDPCETARLSPKISMDISSLQHIFLEILDEQKPVSEKKEQKKKDTPRQSFIKKALSPTSLTLAGQIFFAGVILPLVFSKPMLFGVSIGILAALMYRFNQVVRYRWLGLGIVIGGIAARNFTSIHLQIGLLLISSSFVFEYLGLAEQRIADLRKEWEDALGEDDYSVGKESVFNTVKRSFKRLYFGARLLFTDRAIEKFSKKVERSMRFAPKHYEKNKEIHILKAQRLLHKISRIQARFLYFWLKDERNNIERFIERCQNVELLIWIVFYSWYHKLKKKDYYGYSDLMMQDDKFNTVRLLALSKLEKEFLYQLPRFKDDLYGLLAAQIHPAVREKAYLIIERMDTDPRLLYRGSLNSALVDTWKKAKDSFRRFHAGTYYYTRYIPILPQDEHILVESDLSHIWWQKESEDILDLENKAVSRKKFYIKIFNESIDAKEAKEKERLGEAKADELWQKLRRKYSITDNENTLILRSATVLKQTAWVQMVEQAI
ncbi:MAG: hypothetical protein V1747_03735 [Candidatus Omnitrophota bacterium]